MKFNLLTVISDTRAKQRYLKSLVTVFCLAIGVLFLSSHLILTRKIQVATKQLDYYQQSLNHKALASHNNPKIKAGRRKILDLKKHQQQFAQNWLKIYQGVSRTLWLTTLEFNKQKFKLAGRTKVIADLKQLVSQLATRSNQFSFDQKLSYVKDSYIFSLSGQFD